MCSFTEQLPSLYPNLRSYAFHLTHNRNQTDDLVQDSLCRACSGISQFRGESSLRTWVTEIMFKTFLTAQRLERRRRSIATMVCIEDFIDMLHAENIECIERVECQQVLRLLERLPDDQKNAIIIVSIEEESYEDASRMLNISIGTVKSRVARGREILRKLTDGKTRYHFVPRYADKHGRSGFYLLPA